VEGWLLLVRGVTGLTKGATDRKPKHCKQSQQSVGCLPIPAFTHRSHAPLHTAPQNHTNEDIYEKAVAILETYFDVEDGEEENLAPAVAEGGERSVSRACGLPGQSGRQESLAVCRPRTVSVHAWVVLCMLPNCQAGG